MAMGCTAGKALVVGIDDYAHVPKLHSAERDAIAIHRRLAFHGDKTPNFEAKRLIGRSSPVTRAVLRQEITQLFADSHGLDVAFYFAGHGVIEATGGYLVTCDGEQNDLGVS